MKFGDLFKRQIATTIAVGFGVLLLFLVLTVVVSYVLIDRAEDDAGQLARSEFPLYQASVEMESATSETALAVSDYLKDPQPETIESLQDAEAEFEDAGRELVSLSPSRQQGQQATEMYEVFKRQAYAILTLADRKSDALKTFRESAGEIGATIDERLLSTIDRASADSTAKLETAFLMKLNAASTLDAVESYSLQSDSSLTQQLARAGTEFRGAVTGYRETSLTLYEEGWLQQISDDFNDAFEDGNEIIAISDTLNGMVVEFEAAGGQIAEYIEDQILSEGVADMTDAIEDAQDSSGIARIALLIMAVIGVVLGVPLAWMATRRIMNPLAALLASARSIRDGKVDHRFYIDSKDEFGDLAFTLNQILDHTRRSREALGESEETAWALLDATTDSVILTDTRGIILASNEVAASRLGKSLEQVIDVSLYDLLPADLMASRRAQIAEVVRSGKPLHVEDERESVILDTRIFPAFNDRGQVWRIAIFSSDITTRKWVEEVTERLSRRNELILEAAGEGIYGLDTEGRTTFVNPAAARLLGYRPEDLIGQHHHELVHHSKPNGMPYPNQQCPIYAAFKDGTVHQNVGDEVFWRKDGTSFPVNYTSTPIFEDGRIVGAVVTFQDITGRKRVETALRQSEEKYRLIFENAATLIISSDRNGAIIDCNSQVDRLLGYLPDEVIGHSIFEFVYSEDAQKAKECLKEVLTTGFKYNNQLKFVRKDGAVIDVNMNTATITDSHGEYLRTICMIDGVASLAVLHDSPEESGL